MISGSSRTRPARPPEKTTPGIRFRGFIVGLLCFVFLTGISRAESEATVKALYIFGFAKITDWPAKTFSSPKAPIVIGYTDRDPVSDELRAFAGEKANGHPVEVRRVSAAAPAELRACHIVYVSGAQRPEPILEAIAGFPVLLVGDSENFARKGGAIGFVKVGDAVKFDANPSAPERSGITLNSRLVRVAREVVK